MEAESNVIPTWKEFNQRHENVKKIATLVEQEFAKHNPEEIKKGAMFKKREKQIFGLIVEIETALIKDAPLEKGKMSMVCLSSVAVKGNLIFPKIIQALTTVYGHGAYHAKHDYTRKIDGDLWVIFLSLTPR